LAAVAGAEIEPVVIGAGLAAVAVLVLTAGLLAAAFTVARPADGGGGLASVFVEQADVQEQLAGHIFLANGVLLDAAFGGPLGDVDVQQLLGVVNRALFAVIVDGERQFRATGFSHSWCHHGDC
jgi:hypothetical protein